MMHISASERLEREDPFYHRICCILRENTWRQEQVNNATFWHLPDSTLCISLGIINDIQNFAEYLGYVQFFGKGSIRKISGSTIVDVDDDRFGFSENPTDEEIEAFRKNLVRRSVEALI